MSLETTIAAGILFLIAIGLIACAIKEDKKERARHNEYINQQMGRFERKRKESVDIIGSGD